MMNRGFLYGDGFFETIRIFNGQVPLLHYHIQRIHEGLKIYHLEHSFPIDELFIKSLITNENQIIRVNFFRSGGGKYLPENNELSFDFTCEQCGLPFFLPTQLDLESELQKAPIQLGQFKLYDQPKPVVNWLTVKSLSSIYYVLAAEFMKKSEADYLFIKNQDGDICEELISNILIFDGENYITPSLSSGGIYGVTLRHIISNYHFQIIERKINYDDICHASKIFSLRGTLGITRIK